MRIVWGGAALFLLALAMFAFKPSEPVYDGKPVSYWINRPGVIGPGESRGYASGSDFLTGVAPPFDEKAIPFLIAAVKEKDRPGKLAYLSVWRRLPVAIQRFLPPPINSLKVKIHAEIILGRMRTTAESALPTLMDALQTDEDADARAKAAEALAMIGGSNPSVITALKRTLTNEDPFIRQSATNSLEKLGVLVR